MKAITKTIQVVGVPASGAFRKFVHDLDKWWPQAYTWSQDKPVEIRIDGRANGLCTELGPNGFRCDWGTVTAFAEHEMLEIKWQVGPTRSPIPNPDNAGSIRIAFMDNGGNTTIHFEHFHFEKYGVEGAKYREMMAGEEGWDFILKAFKRFCEEGDR